MVIVRRNFFERRKDVRFRLTDGIFAEFRKPLFFKLGMTRIAKSAPIEDLSLGGLTFKYISREMWNLDFDELSISNAGDKVKIKRLPFLAVSDYRISRLPDSRFLRRCGLKFGELTPNQKYRLHYFVQDYKRDNFPVDRRTGKDRRQMAVLDYDGSEHRGGIERRKQLFYH